MARPIPLRTLVATLALSLNACGERTSPGGTTVGGGETYVPSGGGGDGQGALASEIDPAVRRAQSLDRIAKLKAQHPEAPAESLWTQAVQAEEKQNFKDAKTAFMRLALHHASDDRAPEAAHRAALMAMRLGDYGEALTWLEDAIVLLEGTLAEPRLHRVLGNLYLAVPHYGTRKGGEFHRARYDQGIFEYSYRVDRSRAIEHLETARERYTELAAQPGPKQPKPEVRDKERIEILFDLAGAVARFTPYDASWNSWYYPWRESREDELVDEEGADERVGRWGRQDVMSRARPRGVPVDEQGRVIFVDRPRTYAADLDDTAKLKFLLNEVVELDGSPEHPMAAQALLRQALFFRARDGSQRLQRLAGWWWQGQRPYQEAIEGAKMWDLADDEVMGLIATHIGVYRVPADESPLQLFDEIIERYPKSPSAEDAAYYRGVFFQSRQQYEKAIGAYRSYLGQYPSGKHSSSAQHGIQTIEKPELRLDTSSAQPAGRPASLRIDHRNLETVYLKAVRLDIARVISELEASIGTKAQKDPSYFLNNPVSHLLHSSNRDTQIEKYRMGAWQELDLSLKNDPSHRYSDSERQLPLTQQGLWVLVAYSDAARTRELSRSLLMLESTALIQKSTSEGNLLWVVDSLSGVSISNTQVEVFEWWNDYKDGETRWHQTRFQRKTDARGLAQMPPQAGHQRLFKVKRGDAVSFGGDYFYWNYSPSSIAHYDRALVFTDRPVYRPEHKVQMRVWARLNGPEGYQDAGTVKQITVRINAPKGTKVLEQAQAASPGGSVKIEYVIPKGAPLGEYNVAVLADGRWLNVGGAQFRVEEYKAPELEVKVSVGDGPAKLGEKISVQVRADYYFGGPVENARVRYKIFRSDYEHKYVAPGPWDWLYGPGYGLCYYSYAWFPWWDDWGWHPWAWYPWWGAPPEPVRELVREGEGRLDEHGLLALEIDTTDAKARFGDSDQKFIVEAEVTDASRRTIEGQGEVIATRHQFFVHGQTDRGYYQTGQTVRFSARSLLPSGPPIATKGKLIVARVAYVGDNGDTVEERPIFEKAGFTRGEDGLVELAWDAVEPGQYRISYATEDAWGSEVVGSSLVWVWGPSFDGRRFRFNHLEVITDKRTYEVGETAHLLISSNIADAHVLFSPFVDNGHLLEPSLLKLQGKTAVVDIPITKKHVPNFFVEATVVGEGKISEEVRELIVPPSDPEIVVSVRPKKATLRAGEDSEIEVLTTTPDGKPISAEVAVSVYDRAVTYIQPELTPEVRQFFWGQKRTSQKISTSNLARSYATWQNLERPDQQAAWQLGGVASGFMQGQADFRYGAADGAVAGVGALAADAPMEEKAAAPEPASPGDASRQVAKSELASNRARGDVAGGKNKEQSKDDKDSRAEGGSGLRTPEVRRNFADTAAFETVTTDGAGRASLRVRFPDNLTTWNVKAIGLTPQTQVGEDKTTVVTTKNLLVRLQAPRFFRERDRVMISANIHNRLTSAKEVTVELSVDAELLHIDGSSKRKIRVDKGGEARVDYWVDVKEEGLAKIKVSALTNEESDAKELSFPVLVHGFMKTVSAVGSISAKNIGTQSAKLTFEVPEERRPEMSELVVRWSPSLAGAMADALPYLLEYPYGCTEQTMSRFMPAVLTRRSLQKLGGYTLEDLEKIKESLNPQHLNTKDAALKKRREMEYRRYASNPVFNTAMMDDMIRTGLNRIAKFQRPDGGWGWWASDRASIYTTSYVLWGLWEAEQADVQIPSGMIDRGRNALRGLIQGELEQYLKHEQWVNNSHAFFAFVMSLWGEKNQQLNDLLVARRAQLTPYGKSLLSMALFRTGDKENAKLLLENALQFLQEDPENETAWLDVRKDGWWYWWNSDIETNSMFLRALITVNPTDERAPRVVKWILNHRHNGWYWRSTRDTAIAISAFAQYMQVSGESATDYELEVLLDGKLAKTVQISKANLFSYDGELRLEGVEVTGGKHELELRRKGKGAVYFNVYTSYFTTKEDEEATGLELKVERNYFKLTREDRTHEVYDSKGRKTKMREAAYRKLPLKTGDEVQSGDLILVELMLESKNDYSFLAFEDPKPAGTEPVALRSGTTYGEAVANLELRDDKVVFFLSHLNQGKIRLDYRLRAEIPGTFHAMPTRGFAMYAPEIRANSDEMRLEILDRAEP